MRGNQFLKLIGSHTANADQIIPKNSGTSRQLYIARPTFISETIWMINVVEMGTSLNQHPAYRTTPRTTCYVMQAVTYVVFHKMKSIEKQTTCVCSLSLYCAKSCVLSKCISVDSGFSYKHPKLAFMDVFGSFRLIPLNSTWNVNYSLVNRIVL